MRDEEFSNEASKRPQFDLLSAHKFEEKPYNCLARQSNSVFNYHSVNSVKHYSIAVV